METFVIIVAALSWIVCSWLVGAAAGRYFSSPVCAWVYLGVSLVLSPLVGLLVLFGSHMLDYIEARGRS